MGGRIQQPIFDETANDKICGITSPPWQSLRWWTSSTKAAAQPFIERNAALGGLKWKPRRILCCASSGAESFGSGALGIPWLHESTIACEKLKSRRQFMKEVHKGRIAHIFDSQEVLSRGSTAVGYCDMCEDVCTLKIPNPRTCDVQDRVACVSGGPPCTPVTVFRSNKKRIKPNQHPDYSAMFGDVDCKGGSILGVIKTQRPLGGYIEDVGGMTLKDEEGQSVCDDVMAELRRIDDDDGKGSLYTCVKVMTFKPENYIKLKRTRIIAY